jgi:Phosphoesterase family
MNPRTNCSPLHAIPTELNAQSAGKRPARIGSTSQRTLLHLVAGVTIGAMFAASASAANSANLLVNGDGEIGQCTTDWSAVTTVPGWTVVSGNPALVCYSIGAFPVPAAPAPGAAFIADGPYGDSVLTQSVDVSSAAATIDAGGVSLNLSGWLGGWGSYEGQAQLTAAFLDANGNAVGTATQLSGVDAAARGNLTQFLARNVTAPVPAQTRTIAVTLQFVDTAGSYNVGYADNLALTLSTPVTAPILIAPVSSVPQFDHVFVVMMENTNYDQVIGDATDAPFINGVAAQGTLLSNYSGVYHPSDENYLAIAAGGTFVDGAIYYPSIHVSSQHIGDELEALGKTWRAYEQGMGTPCNTLNNIDSYYEPDDAPFINFTDISTNTARCQAHLFDTTQLTTDLQSAASTPNFSWIAADDYYDGESSGNGSPNSLRVQDGWLRQTLQPVFNSPAWQTQRSLLILTWDESSTSQNNHIATIVVGSQGLVRAGAVSGTSYNHFSSGRTVEQALGIGQLTPNDTYAVPINDAFAAASVASLSTLTTAVPDGTAVNFDYATPGATLSSSNWIGIYPADVRPGEQASLTWQYVSSAQGAASFNAAVLGAGSYSAWYCYNNGYTVLAGPIDFSVSP